MRIGAVWAYNLICLWYMDSLSEDSLPAPVRAALAPFIALMGPALGAWQTATYFLSLRCISAACDLSDINEAEFGKLLRFRLRADPLPSSQQSTGLTMYLAHCLYPPLYLAGPILRFAPFVDQHVRSMRGDERSEGKNGSRGTNGPRGTKPTELGETSSLELEPLHPFAVLRYTLRWVGLFLFIEAAAHCFYPSAAVQYLSASVRAGESLRPSPSGLSLMTALT